MDSEAFTIRIFVVDGDPEGIRLVVRMNWTGVAVVFPRDQWPAARRRPELSRTGAYILIDYKEGDNDLPTIYVDEGDAVAAQREGVQLADALPADLLDQGARPLARV